MLTIDKLSKSFGQRRIFDSVSWSMADDARVGLVGLNGAGKSTLLRMIAGLVEPDDGRITRPQRTRVGYLPQDAPEMAGRTVLEEVLGGLAEMRALDARRRELELALAGDGAGLDYDGALAELGEVLHELERHDFYTAESRAEAVLFGLGFDREDLGRDSGEFSGGIRMRIALARLLLQAPEFMMLDEPTNHLDIEARNWLEEYLVGYRGGIIMVSHDRYFLDRVTERTLEVARARLTEYPGGYSRYLVEREKRFALEMAAYEKQRVEIEHLETFISRFRYQASKAALVQSRVKQLEKLDRLQPPAGAEKPPAIRFPACARGGRRAIELAGAVKRYGDLTVYDGLDLVLERGARVALVGPNGAGKSTMMKLLAGVEELSSGRRTAGDKVEIGYFAQNLADSLDYDKTVFDALSDEAPAMTTSEVRSLLGAMLFSGDEVEKRAGVLSGGERARLALAMVLARSNNCLLLDEPTNNLDIVAKDTLLEALRRFPGTVAIVSHDRYILNELVNEVIEVGQGRALRYLGNYDDYLRKKAEMGDVTPASEAAAVDSRSKVDTPAHDATPSADRARPIATARSKPGAGEGGVPAKTRGDIAPRAGAQDGVAPPSGPTGRADRLATREAQREAARKRAVMTRRRTAIEAEIGTRETERASLANAMNDPDFYLKRPDANEMIRRYEKLGREIETLYADLLASDSAG